MNKKTTLVVVLSFLFLLVFGAAYTYSVFESSASGAMEAEIADFIIKVNSDNIVDANPITFDLGDMHVDDSISLEDVIYKFDIKIEENILLIGIFFPKMTHRIPQK